MQIYDCYLKGFLQFCTNKGYTSVHHKDTIFRTAHQQQLTAPIFKLLMAWSNNPGHAKSREELICSLDTLRTVTAWWTHWQDQQTFYNWYCSVCDNGKNCWWEERASCRIIHHGGWEQPRPVAEQPPPQPPLRSPGRRKDCPLRRPCRLLDRPRPVVESAVSKTDS